MSTRAEQQIPFRFHVGLRVSTEQTEPDRIATESCQRALSVDPKDNCSKRKWLRWKKGCEVEQ
jgi:hypothetical protein